MKLRIRQLVALGLLVVATAGTVSCRDGSHGVRAPDVVAVESPGVGPGDTGLSRSGARRGEAGAGGWDGDGPMQMAMRAVAEHRGWPIATAFPLTEGSGEELLSWITEEVRVQVPLPVDQAMKRCLHLLGLVPAVTDPSEVSVISALASSVRGIYLPTRQSIVVRRGLSQEELATTLSHEVVHAYQDRLYNLGAALEFQPGKGDRISAWHALAEGEATRIEVELARLSRRGNEGLSDEVVLRRLEGSLSHVELPAVLRRSLIAPYRDGYRFVSYVRGIGGWDLLDSVWRRGVATTAELLHPERWISARGVGGEEVSRQRSIGDEDLLDSGGWGTVVFWDSLGELGLRTVLEETVSAEIAAEQAAGWEHDRIWLLEAEGSERLAWYLRFRSRSQAQEVESSLRGLLIGTGVRDNCDSMPTGTVALRREGHDIVVVASGVVSTGAGATRRQECERLRGWMGRLHTWAARSVRNN